MVYEADRDVRVCDVVTKRSQTLSDGQHPTWSPDGTQIAFMRDDGYYSVSPSGTQPPRLFKKFQPQSGLFWSPDSRFVVYAYQHHVRLLSPEPVVVMQPQSTRVEEPTLLCKQIGSPSGTRPVCGLARTRPLRRSPVLKLVKDPTSERFDHSYRNRWRKGNLAYLNRS